MNQDPFKEYRHESEPGKKERYQAWRAAIGLQAVDGLETSPYLLDTALHQRSTCRSISGCFRG